MLWITFRICYNVPREIDYLIEFPKKFNKVPCESGETPPSRCNETRNAERLHKVNNKNYKLYLYTTSTSSSNYPYMSGYS